jgi:hypothetical protein
LNTKKARISPNPHLQLGGASSGNYRSTAEI